MNATETSRLKLTSMAVKSAVAAERERAVEIVRCAYDREGGAELSCVRLALVLVQQGVDVETAKGIIDSAVPSTGLEHPTAEGSA